MTLHEADDSALDQDIDKLLRLEKRSLLGKFR